MLESSEDTSAGVAERPAGSTWGDSAALAMLALAVAGPNLGSPPVFMFDEIYYVSDAVSHLELGVGRGFQAHPPLGTWLVAAGIALVDSPLGWRLASLLLGAVSVVALHRLAVRAFPGGSTGRLLAALAAVLLVTDGSWLVLSRTAMLDGPLTALILVGAATAFAVPASGPRRWVLSGMAGAAIGAAMAVKWSGALAVPLAISLLFVGHRQRGLRDRVRAMFAPGALLLVAAAMAYAAAWVPFAVHRDEVPLGNCIDVAAPCPDGGGVGAVIDQHLMLVRYHTRIQSDTSAASPPSLWPLLQGRVGFYRPDCHDRSEPVPLPTTLDAAIECPPDLPVGLDTILYGGNVVIWLGFAALLPVLAAAARRRHLPARIALLGWGSLWLPWLLSTRVSYLWYAAPMVPFAALGLAAVAATLPRVRIAPTYARAAGGATIGVVLTLLTPLPAATALIGWAAGGFVGDGRALPAMDATALAQLTIAGVLTTAAAVTAAVNHSSWTAG